MSAKCLASFMPATRVSMVSTVHNHKTVHNVRNCTLGQVWLDMTLISLQFCAVRSESFLDTVWLCKNLRLLWTEIVDSSYESVMGTLVWRYRIWPYYCTYSYKRTVKQVFSIQIKACVFFIYFIKAYLLVLIWIASNEYQTTHAYKENKKQNHIP